MSVELGIIIGVAAIALIVFLVNLFRRSPEERKEYLIEFLCGLVVAAEEEIGEGKGQEKLEAVEAAFKKKAPITMKLMLKISGKTDLKGLIELALQKVKTNFDKK